ncbi:MAG TPA: hypothetical protein VFT49_02505 [Candidatus Saccharimonadales bacterium]|nr:hypothetical protein [Candidatus Saccharimonadales bacterium]
MPRTAETTPTNPTGIPMRLESGIWMPGEATATNIQNSNQILRNSSPTKVEIGDIGGGARSIPVMEAGDAGGQAPSTPETTGDPRLDALMATISQQAELINQLREQQSQTTAVLERLVALLEAQQAQPTPPGEPAPTEPEPEPTPVEPEPTVPGEPTPTVPGGGDDNGPTDAEMNRLRTEALQEDRERNNNALTQRAERAQKALNRARDDLVRFTILRRARSISSLWHRGEGQAYDAAQENYRNALRDFMAAQAEGLRAQNPDMSDAEIIEALAPMEYAEQKAFAERVHSMDQEMFENGQKSLRERMLRRWANYSTKKKLLIGVLAGAGAGFASVGLGLGIAGVAVGLATRYAFGVLNHVASARNVSEKSKDAEVRRISGREQRENGRRASSRLRFGPNGQTVDDYLDNDMLDRNEGYHGREMRRARGRNGLGLAIMGASGLLIGMDMGGVDVIPHVLRGDWSNFLHEIGDKVHGIHHHGGGEGSSFTVPGHGGGSEYASWDIKPSTIHATNMTDFNKGVVSLLQQQGIHVHNFNQHVVDHMNHYMENRPMASGMDASGHQHLISGNFSFGNPSHAQGFEIGSNGNGQTELLRWMDEATKQGATFSRS